MKFSTQQLFFTCSSNSSGKYFQIIGCDTIKNYLFRSKEGILEMEKCICYTVPRQKWWKCPMWHAKNPEMAVSGFFYSVFRRVAYALGWLPITHLCPAICRWGGKQHLPRQKWKMMKVYPMWLTPFLYLSRGGSLKIITYK